MQTLETKPLLPLTQKQRGMIGEARVQESIKAQLHGRCLAALPADRALGRKMSYFPSSVHPDRTVDAGPWCSGVLSQVALATRTCGNHVCRPDVCHKGHIGKKGFCRMYFWHWARFVNAEQKDVAKMTHGQELYARWDGTGTPPLRQSPPFVGGPGA